jgi:hypothetical protein
MAYSPDATNSAQPADTGVQAATAAAEFRAIKTYYLAQFALKAPLASPTFTGVPLSTTAAVDTNTTQIATTAYVIAQGYLKSATASSTYAPLASPTLTGVPAAPTAAVDTNTTQIATTAYVIGQGYLKSATAASTYATIANDNLKAPIASPTFTGVPAGPTAAVDTNTTQLATTAYVIGQGYLKSATAASTYLGIGAAAASVAAANITGATLAAGVTASSLTSIAAGATVGGTEIGFRRAIAGSVTTGSIAASDSGKGIYATAGVTIPNSTFAQGDIVTIYNTTAGAITITISTTTAWFNGAAAGASKSLAAHGACTVIFGGATDCILSGNLS